MQIYYFLKNLIIRVRRVDLTQILNIKKEQISEIFVKNFLVPILILVFSVQLFFKNLELKTLYVLLDLFLVDFTVSVKLNANNLQKLPHLDPIGNYENLYYFSINSNRVLFSEKLNYVLMNGQVLTNLESLKLKYFEVISVISNNFFINNKTLSEEFLLLFCITAIVWFWVFYLYKMCTLYTITILSLFGLSFAIIAFLLFKQFMLFKSYDLFIHYSIFKINYSFLNKNVYIDSNYFLTSDNLRGLEKFTELTVPWMVDSEDSGWGGDFEIQEQIDLMREREHKLVTEDMELNNSPLLTDREKSDGSFNSRFLKIKQRFDFFIKTLTEHADINELLWKSWQIRKLLHTEAQNFYNLEGFVFNFFEFENFKKINPNNTILGNTQIIDTKEILDDLFSDSDFFHAKPAQDYFLPKKNNITNDYFNNSSGNIFDRKQVVYRNLINQNASVEKSYDVKYRKPDTVLDTNYIFERQLQNLRISEYNIKEKLFEYFDSRWQMYSKTYENKTIQKKKLIFSKIEELDYNLDNFKNIKNYGYLNDLKLPNYSLHDAKLENLVSFWNSDNLEKDDLDLRSYEYVYFKNSEKFIKNFNPNDNFILEAYSDLLLNNDLGLGTFTYQSEENTPWAYDSLEFFEIFKKTVKDSTLSLKLSSLPDTNQKKYYLNLTRFIEQNFKTCNSGIRKKLLIYYTKRYLEAWFDFEKICNNWDLLFKIIHCEFVLENLKNLNEILTILPVYIKLTNMFLNSNFLTIKDGWGVLINNKKIEEKNNNLPPQLNFNYLLKRNNVLLSNYRQDSILQTQKQSNFYLFKKLKNLNFEKIDYFGNFQNKNSNTFLQIAEKVQNYGNGIFINAETVTQKYYNNFYSTKVPNILNLFSLFGWKINALSGIFSLVSLKEIYFTKKISNIEHKFVKSDDCNFNKKIYLFYYKIEELPKPTLENIVVVKSKKTIFNYFNFLTNFFEEGLASVLLNIENSKKILRFWIKVKHIWTWQTVVSSYFLYFRDLVNSKFSFYFLDFGKKIRNPRINTLKFSYNYFELKKLIKIFVKTYVYTLTLGWYLFCKKGFVFLVNNGTYCLGKNKLGIFDTFFIKILENTLKRLNYEYWWCAYNLDTDKIKKLYLSWFKDMLIYFYEKHILVFLDILTFLFLEKIKKIWKLKIFGEYGRIENRDNYWTLFFFSKTSRFLKKTNQIYISCIWKVVCWVYDFYIILKNIESEVFFFIEWVLDFITDLEKGKVSFHEIFNPLYAVANKIIYTWAFKFSSIGNIFINKKLIFTYNKFLYDLLFLILFLEYRSAFIIPEYFISDYINIYKTLIKNYEILISFVSNFDIFNHIYFKNYNDFYIKNKSLFENWYNLILKIKIIVLQKVNEAVEGFYLKYFKKNDIIRKIILSQYYQNWIFLEFNLNLFAYGYSKINKKLVLDLDTFCIIYIKVLVNIVNSIMRINIKQNFQIGDWVQLKDEIMLEGLIKTIIFTYNSNKPGILGGKKQIEEIITKQIYVIFLKEVRLSNPLYGNISTVESRGSVFLRKKIKKFYLNFNSYKNNKISILKVMSNFSFWKSKNVKMWKKVMGNFSLVGGVGCVKKLKIKSYWHCWKSRSTPYRNNLSYIKIGKIINVGVVGSVRQTKKQNSLKYNELALRSLDTLKQELGFNLLYFVKKLSIANYFDFFYDDLVINFNKNLSQMRKKEARYSVNSIQFYTNFWKLIKKNLKNNKISQFLLNSKFLVKLEVKNPTFNYSLINFENKNKQILIFKLQKLKKTTNGIMFNSLKFNPKITIVGLFNYIKTWKLVKNLAIFENSVKSLYNLQKDVYISWYRNKLQIIFKNINNFKELKLILFLKLNFEIMDIRSTKNNKKISKPQYVKNGLLSKLFNNAELLKNKKQVNNNFKLLEFFNFSNFSEDFTINLSSFWGSLKNKKYFTKKNVDILTVGGTSNHKKHTQTELPDFVSMGRKLPKIINTSRVPYITVNYFINYLNYRNYKFNWKNPRFTNPSIIFNQNLSLKTWADFSKRYEIGNYKNTNSYFKLEKVINYSDKNLNKSNLFDITQKTQLIKKLTISFLNIFILKLKYYIVIHQQKIQIWGLRINLEKLEWFFGFSKLDKYFLALWQDSCRLGMVHNLKKSNQDLFLFLNFGEKHYNFVIFRKFLTILIFKKIKMLQLFDFLINNHQDRTITPFERQGFLLQIKQSYYLENFLIKNLNKFIDLMVLFRKIDHKFFFTYKITYFLIQNIKFELFSYFFENLQNSTLVEMITFIYKSLEFFLNLFFSTILHCINKYLLSVNYLIADYPYLFHRGFSDSSLSKNKFHTYYISCVLNIKLIILEIEQKKLLIVIENTLPKLSYFFEIFYEYYMYESENSENFQGKKEVLSIGEVWEDVFDLSFEYLILSWQSFLECRGQLIWLDVCLFFDYIFEIFTSFDDEDEGNPFSKPITLAIEILRKMLNGSPFSGYQFSDIELEFREIFIKYYDKAGADSKYATDYGLHAHNDSYFEDNELIEENSRNVELGHFNGIDQLDDTDTLDFLGWGFENNLGTDPSLEFSSINDILEIPKNIENYFNFDISNWYHEFFGLNSPNLGEIAPSFDITLPIKSLWLVGVLYYDPKKGGLLLVDSEALFRFFTILFLDKRTSFFSKVYQMADWELSSIKSQHFFLIKLKIIFILHDILQSIETIYINPFDFFEFFFFYIIFLINYYGIWFIFSMYFIFIIFGKATMHSERILRKYSRNGTSVSWLSAYLYNYAALRFIYPLITNSYLFLRMTLVIVIVLSLLYIFSEGLHIFSILRVFSIDHESVNNINAMYFLMERDPFVEKHVPNDEIWDEFRYDSTIDDEWSRIHYHREHAEIFGGNIREGAAPFELTGFSKKMNYIYNIHDNAHDTETTPSKKVKSVLDQIHNRIPDEGSFMPSFILDTELEREFFRESEMRNGEIEGSADWGLRSEERIRDKLEGYQLANYFNNSALLDRSRFGSNINILENNLYAALLINYYDPKWLWDETTILSERVNKPLLFSHNKKELYNNYDDMPNNTRILREVLAENRLISIIKRNRGIVQQNPILDFWDEDPYTDFGLEIASDFGSSIGSQSNQIDTWNIFLGDIITQKTKFSIKPNAGSGMYFNYLTNDDELPVNYYESENLILENFVETIFNNPTPSTFNTKMYSTDQKKQKRNYMYNLNKYIDAYETYFNRSGRFPTLENNAINNLFPQDDYLGTDDLDYFTGVFIDINNYKNENKSFLNTGGNLQNISLENLRRRDLFNKKLEGNDPVTLFYDEMAAEDVEKEIYRNLDNASGIAPRSFSSFFRNNEFMTKSNLNVKNAWTRSQPLDLISTLTEGDTGDQYEFLGDGYSEFNEANPKTKISYFSFRDNKIKFKKQNNWIQDKLVKKNIKNNLETKTPEIIYQKQKKHNHDSWGGLLNMEYFKWLNLEIPNISTNSFANKKVKNDKNLIKNEKLIFKKNLINFTTKKIETATKTKQIQLNALWNNYFIKKIKNKKLNTSSSNIFFEKIKENFKKNIKFFELYENKKNRLNLKNSFETENKGIGQIFKKIKNKENRLSVGENYFRIKHKVAEKLSKKKKIKNNKLNDIYRKKITDYILSKANIVINKNNQKKYGRELLTKLNIFFNDKWYLDHTARLNYDHFNWNTNDYDIWDTLGGLKKKGIPFKDPFFEKTRLSEYNRYGKNRGYWGKNTESQNLTDLRMHGLFKIDHFPSPIYQNDDEAFQEYIELWNPNFGKLKNNLEYLSKGNVMGIHEYEYNHLLTDDELEYWETESLDHHTSIHDEFEQRMVGEPFKKDILGIPWYPKTYEKYLGLGRDKKLKKLPKKIAKELELKRIDFSRSADWYKPLLKKKIILKKKLPWGWDSNSNYFWSGTQYYNFGLNGLNLNMLFKKKYYNLNSNNSFESLIDGGFKFKRNQNVENSLKKKYNNRSQKNQIDFEMFDKGAAQINDTYSKFSNYKKTNNQNLKIKVNKKPEPFDATTFDFGTEAELKESFGDNDFEYGKNIISLKQHALMSDYWEKNIPQQNRVITPMQSSEYFWYLYKKQKQNNSNYFFKKLNYSKTNISGINNTITRNWEEKIKNPEIRYDNYLFTKFFDKDIKIDNEYLEDLGDSWLSSRLLKTIGLNFSKNKYRLEDLIADEAHYKKLKKSKKTPNTKSKIRRGMLRIFKNIGYLTNTVKSVEKVKFFHKRTPTKNIKKNKNNFLYHMGLFVDYDFFEKKKNQLFGKKNKKNLIDIKKITFKKKPVTFKHNVVFDKKINEIISHELARTALKEIYELPLADTKLQKLEMGTIYNFDDDDENYVEVGLGTHSEFTGEYITDNELLGNNNAKVNQDLIKNSLFFRQLNKHGYDSDDLVTDTLQNYNAVNFIDQQNQENSEIFEIIKNKSLQIPNFEIFKYRNNNTRFDKKNEYLEDDFVDTDDILQNFEILNNFESNSMFWDESLDYTDSNSLDSSEGFLQNLDNSDPIDFDDDDSEDSEIFENDSKIFDELGEKEISGFILEDFEDSFEEDSDLIDDDDDDDDDDDFESDDDIFFNKIINTNLHGDVDYRSPGILKSFENEDTLLDVDAFEDIEDFENNDDVFLLFENENVFYNKNLSQNNRNRQLPTKWRNWVNLNKNVWDRKNLKNKLGFVSENYLNLGKKINSSIRDANSDSFAEYGLDENTIKNKIIVSGGNSLKKINKNLNYTTSFLLPKKNYKQILGNINENNKKYYYKKYYEPNFQTDQLGLGVWKNKQNNYNFGGELPNSWGLDSVLKNNILNKNKSLIGITSSFNLKKNSVFLDKTKKIDYTFSNRKYTQNRYTDLGLGNIIKNQNFKLDNNAEDTSNLAVSFKYGLSGEDKFLGSKKLSINKRFGYFKYNNTQKIIESNIDGFFKNFDQNKNEADVDYISSVTYPVQVDFEKKIKKPSTGYFILNQKKEDLQKYKFENINQNKINMGIDVGKNLDNIFKSAYSTINAKGEKVVGLSFKKYSASETIQPMPVLRSLSVDSKLFSKINSLRLFGAGRLNESIYNPKLKHLLKNQVNFYEIDDSEEDLDINEETYVLKLEKSDEEFDKNLKPTVLGFGQISEEIWKANQSENSKSFYRNTPINQFLKKNYLNLEIKLKNLMKKSKKKYSNLSISLQNTENLHRNYYQDNNVFEFFNKEFDDVLEITPEVQDTDAFEVVTLTPTDVEFGKKQLEKKKITENLSNHYLLKKQTVLNNFGEFEEHLENIDDDFFDYDVENSFEDADDGFWEKHIDYNNGDMLDIVSKEDWLFELYKEIVDVNAEKDQNWFWQAAEDEVTTDDLIENFDMEELSQLEDLENLEHAKETLFVENGGLVSENLESPYNTNSDLLFFNDILELDDLYELQESYINDLTLGDNFDSNFDEDYSDFEELDQFIQNQYDNFVIPNQVDSRTYLEDLNFENLGLLTLDSLNKRDFGNFNSATTYLNQENLKIKNKYYNPPLIKIDPFSLDRLSALEKINRAEIQDSLDFGLERNPWADTILDFELFEINKILDDDVVNGNFNSNIEEKLENINKFENDNLLNDLGNYFIKDKGLLLNQENIYEDLPTINNSILENGGEFLDIFFKNETKHLWNIKNQNKDSKLLKIKQRQNLENLTQIDVKLLLGSIKNKTIIKKNILNTEKANLGIFLRKTNTIQNSGSERTKFKNLKKKYWYRLDILERFVSNLKKNIKYNSKEIENKNTTKNEKPLQVEFGDSSDKNILNAYKIKENYITNNLQLDATSLEGLGSDFKNNNNYENFKKLKQNIKNLKKNKTLEDFWNYKKQSIFDSKGSTKYEIFDNIEQQQFYNIFGKHRDKKYTNVTDLNLNTDLSGIFGLMANKQPLVEDFKGLYGAGVLNSAVINKNVDALGFSTSNGVENERDFEAFEKIRSNMSKFQTYSNSNNYLPVDLISNFLYKLPNFGTYSYIGEGLKKLNNYELDSISKNNQDLFIKKLKQRRGVRSVNKLNTHSYFRKLPAIDDFSVYHKPLERPGLEFKNKFSKIQIDPFRTFSSKNTLINRGDIYGLGTSVYKNNLASRRIYGLALRTFGPDIRTNSITKGYGRFDDVFEMNTSTDDMTVELRGLGYPILSEQNTYNTDYPAGPVSGSESSIYEAKLVDYLWDLDALEEDEPETIITWEPGNENSGYGLNYDIFELIASIFAERSNNEADVYPIKANYERYVGIWNQKSILEDREHIDTENEDYLEAIENGEDFTIKEVEDSLSDLKLTEDRYWDWQFLYDTDFGRTKKNLENKVTRKLYFNKSKNIGPLGYEEGDSLHDNRLLNRGWFPEKEVFGWGSRTHSGVGSDASTLELLADYRATFNFEIEDYTDKYKYESFKDLGWAGNRNNKLFDTIDDIVEGFGFEENIPFTPELAEKIWHKEEYVNRYVYDDFDFGWMEKDEYPEDDEQDDYSIYTDPDGFYYYNDRLFNTLGFANFVASTTSWEKSKYLANLDSLAIPGIANALADNELHDGLLSDFSNFIQEKLPQDPINIFKQQNLPLVTSGIFRSEDYFDSKIPEFSEFVNESGNDQFEAFKERRESTFRELSDRDSSFYSLETYKPKDMFSFTPNNGTFQRFEQEWVINGEGWLGNTGFNLSPLGQTNLPVTYISTQNNIFTQPKGIHSFETSDDLDLEGGLDSPYYSLSDFQKNRIIRGRDNDVSNFPIKFTWNNISQHIPDWYNAFWKHRLNFGEAEFQTLGKSWNFETSKQMGGIGIPTGIDIPFSNIIGENPDFINYSNDAINERTLWWRAVDSGVMSQKNKENLAFGILSGGGENYRDFLLSYDFKLFGKNWVNPQETKIPLKSFNFYGDSQINTFLSNSENSPKNSSEGVKSLDEDNFFSDFTYGIFKDSQLNGDVNTVFFAQQLRDYLYKLFEIGLKYTNSIFDFLKSKITRLFTYLINILIYKIENFNFILKLIFINDKLYRVVTIFIFELLYFSVLPLIFTIKKIFNFFLLINFYLLNFEIIFTDNIGFLVKNGIIFELFYDFFYIFWKIKFKLQFLENYYSYFIILANNIVFILVVLVIILCF